VYLILTPAIASQNNSSNLESPGQAAANPNESETSTLKHPAYIQSPQQASLPIEPFNDSEDEEVENVENNQLDEEDANKIMDYLGKDAGLGKNGLTDSDDGKQLMNEEEFETEVGMASDSIEIDVTTMILVVTRNVIITRRKDSFMPLQNLEVDESNPEF
jgi:hypothetical protein